MAQKTTEELYHLATDKKRELVIELGKSVKNWGSWIELREPDEGSNGKTKNGIKNSVGKET